MEDIPKLALGPRVKVGNVNSWSVALPGDETFSVTFGSATIKVDPDASPRVLTITPADSRAQRRMLYSLEERLANILETKIKIKDPAVLRTMLKHYALNSDGDVEFSFVVDEDDAIPPGPFDVPYKAVVFLRGARLHEKSRVQVAWGIKEMVRLPMFADSDDEDGQRGGDEPPEPDGDDLPIILDGVRGSIQEEGARFAALAEEVAQLGDVITSIRECFDRLVSEGAALKDVVHISGCVDRFKEMRMSVGAGRGDGEAEEVDEAEV
jgi:hypothetical protein